MLDDMGGQVLSVRADPREQRRAARALPGTPDEVYPDC
jgi:hypothetical protein